MAEDSPPRKRIKTSHDQATMTGDSLHSHIIEAAHEYASIAEADAEMKKINLPTHQRPHLLNIAAELRLIIYDHYFDALVEEHETDPRKYVFPDEWPDNDFTGFTSLILTCKEIRNEATAHFMQYYLHEVRLHFTCLDDLCTYAERSASEDSAHGYIQFSIVQPSVDAYVGLLDLPPDTDFMKTVASREEEWPKVFAYLEHEYGWGWECDCSARKWDHSPSLPESRFCCGECLGSFPYDNEIDLVVMSRALAFASGLQLTHYELSAATDACCVVVAGSLHQLFELTSPLEKFKSNRSASLEPRDTEITKVYLEEHCMRLDRERWPC